jgi:hypothetical protein
MNYELQIVKTVKLMLHDCLSFETVYPEKNMDSLRVIAIFESRSISGANWKFATGL